MKRARNFSVLALYAKDIRILHFRIPSLALSDRVERKLADVTADVIRHYGFPATVRDLFCYQYNGTRGAKVFDLMMEFKRYLFTLLAGWGFQVAATASPM